MQIARGHNIQKRTCLLTSYFADTDIGDRVALEVAGGAAIHEVDLLNLMLSGAGNSNSAIEPIVQADYPRVSEDSSLDEVSQMFTRSTHEAVMVTRGDKPTDIITKIDLIDYLLQSSGNGKT